MALTRIRAQQISDIDYKQAVRVITLSDITLAGGAPNLVDGVTLVAGDRILVAGQSTGSQNGLYDVSVLGTGSNGTWVRTADGDVTGEIQAGMIVMVTEGDSYKDTQWKLTTNNPIVIGTTPLIFEQNSAFAFGNIYANGTAVLANSVGSTVTLTPGNNIAITGNNTSKNVTIAVTGLSLNSISNGTSNVNVVSSGGNVTIGVGGTANVAEFSAGGLAITGDLSVTGNATLSGNILGDRIVNGSTSFEIQAAGGNANITVGGVSNVTVFTAAGQEVTGNVSASGNITAGYYFGNGASLTGIITSVANINDGSSIMEVVGSGGNIRANIGGTSNVMVLATTGQYITGLQSVSGNISGGNLLTLGQVSATGNVTGNYFIGNGSQLTGISSDTIGGNLQVLTRSSGLVNFVVTAGYLAVYARSGTISIPLSP